MQIHPTKKLTLLFSSLLFLSACGPASESLINLNERLVPVDTESSVQTSEEAIVEDDPTTLVEGFPQDMPLMSLRDKVLMSSSVSQKALDKAFAFYNKNQNLIRNKRYITIFDISQHSGRRRLFLIDVNTGSVQSMHVAHGIGSDRDHDGVATVFSNTNGSKMSSLGFMLTAETYFGKHGESLRLDGLEARNSNVRSRAIVVHSAAYVSDNLSKMGRSEGCPAIPLEYIKDYLNKTKNGSLFYIYHGSYDP